MPCPLCGEGHVKLDPDVVRDLIEQEPLKVLARETVKGLTDQEVRKLLNASSGVLYSEAAKENHERKDTDRPSPKDVRATVACPKPSCEADVDHPCVSKTGNPLTEVHIAREEAYLAHTEGQAEA